MASTPIFEESHNLSAGPMISVLSGIDNRNKKGRPMQLERLQKGKVPRKLAIYDANAGFDMIEELEFLTYRAIEPNIFFSPNFLIPAMPRLDERTVRLIVMRDEKQTDSRLRLVMPYSIERPGFGTTPLVIRCWGNKFGPNGTPLIDNDDPVGVVQDLFSILGRDHLRMPPIIVFPLMPTKGPVAKIIRSVAIESGLPLQTTNRHQRAMMESDDDGEIYLKRAISKNHYREINRQWRKLAEQGTLEYKVASKPDDVRIAVESYLALENEGWKGRARTAMINNRLQAAFARETTNNLAAIGKCRVHGLYLNGEMLAALIVFVENGVASTWKITFDENYSRFSPGKLLLMRVTEYLLDDFNVLRADSCAYENHPLMDHLWTERTEFSTIVVGLHHNTDRQVRQVAGQLDVYEQTRGVAKSMRDRILLGMKQFSAPRF